MPVEFHGLPETVSLRATEYRCPLTGAFHLTLTACRRHAACYGVYVGHPISGIRVSRITEMQDTVRAMFSDANAGGVQRVATFFPMRTTHLSPGEIGANVYGEGISHFSATRHFTLQNRLDALANADAVLLNFDLRDDAGTHRVSRGMPFDWGWAGAAGKPVVAVIGSGNPNLTGGLTRSAALVTDDLARGVRFLNGLLPHSARRPECGATVEIFDFTSCAVSLDVISRLAAADAAKHAGGGRAVITVMPEGDANASFHGQVREASDWTVPTMEDACAIARQLLGAAG